MSQQKINDSLIRSVANNSEAIASLASQFATYKGIRATEFVGLKASVPSSIAAYTSGQWFMLQSAGDSRNGHAFICDGTHWSDLGSVFSITADQVVDTVRNQVIGGRKKFSNSQVSISRVVSSDKSAEKGTFGFAFKDELIGDGEIETGYVSQTYLREVDGDDVLRTCKTTVSSGNEDVASGAQAYIVINSISKNGELVERNIKANCSIFPTSTGKDLGSSSVKWNTVYCEDIALGTIASLLGKIAELEERIAALENPSQA